MRSTAGVDTPTDGSDVAVPLTGNTWTQAPGELDIGPYGRITYTAPGAAACGGTGFADLAVSIYVDGTSVAFVNVQSSRDGATQTRPITSQQDLFEPDTATAHTITAKVSSACESGTFPVSFHVGSVKVDFVRAT